MTILYFVRHGQTIWNQEHRMQGFKNSALTPRGLQQADQLGQHLTKLPKIDRILVSPSPRAQQTAQHLNAQIKRPITTVPEFQELNMGCWEGQTHQAIQQASPVEWQRFWHDPTAFEALNGGETFSQLQQRAQRGFERSLQVYPKETLLIVAHRVTLRVLLAQLLQQPIVAIPDPQPTSLTKLTLTAGRYQVAFMNRISHDE